MNKPKRPFFRDLGAALLLCALGSPTASTAQAPGDEQAVTQLVAEIAAQQAKMTANQQAIDQKLAAIEENMRLARIFVSRGGPIAPKK